MVSFNSILLSVAAIVAITSAAPTDYSNLEERQNYGCSVPPTTSSPSQASPPPPTQVNPNRATHSVTVGKGLTFDPENIVAEIGDVVEFHYLPKNHSVAQSSFANPCVPIGPQAFFSGFLPTTPEEVQNPDTFTITVTSNTPTWFYCAQTVGSHCQMGMAGVINQDFNGPNTLAAYKEAAAKTGVSVAPATIGGGVLGPNPNPLEGFP